MNARTTSALSFALDVADLIVLPRMLVGVKQRAEGALPGMPGTRRGDPLPMARLPVQPATAIVWIGVLSVAAALGVVLRAYVLPSRAWTPGRWVPRAAVAVAETGAFVVLPTTVLWQAATAGGLVTSWRAHVLVGAAAASGSAVVPLLAAALAETARRRTVQVADVHVEERLRDVHRVAP